MAYIDMYDIKKKYDVKQIFDGLDFHIEEGEIVAIIGQNGCGKSTLMKLAIAQEEPDEEPDTVTEESVGEVPVVAVSAQDSVEILTEQPKEPDFAVKRRMRFQFAS